MMDDVSSAEQCQSMAEVRAGVDAADRALIMLLAKRFAYMRAAARIKPERVQVRDDARKAEVIAHARSLSLEAGLPADIIADIWDKLVEASIAYELAEWDRLKG